MGYRKFQIVVDSPTGSYYAGSTVTGKVLLELEKEKKIRGLRIKFEGSAKVSWTKSQSVRKDNGETENENVTYSSEEEYFSNKYFLVGSESSEMTIPAGEHVYPFTSALPPRLPTSFEGEHGFIRYTIRATLDRPWKTDEETQLNFTVVTPVDLNYVPHIKEPVKMEVHRNFCCLCCKSGPLTLVGVIPFSGYVPGQTIPVTIEVDNASNKEIASVKCKLVKELRWIARSPKNDEKVDIIKLAKIELDEGVPAHGSKSWSQNLAIPEMPFFNFDDCSIIKVKFYLKLEADPRGMFCASEVVFPLTLGTVPLLPSPGAPGPTPGEGPTPGGGLYPPIQEAFQPLAPEPTELSPLTAPTAPIGFVLPPTLSQ